MAELTENSPEVVLAAAVDGGTTKWWLSYFMRYRNDMKKWSSGADAARRLAAEGKLGPVAQPEPETWEPTMRLRMRRRPYQVTADVCQQLWRSSSGAEEWRDVEAGG